MISIGIPFFNAAAYLEDAIKSVLAQTFQEWELILVDDGSSDGSLDIAKKYEQLDSRVRVISDGLNKKLPTRLNEIIKEAKFNLIARMDADDLMDVERLEKQYAFLSANPEYDLVTTGMYSIDQSNEVLGKRLPENRIMQANEILGGLTNLLHASMLAKKQWCLRNPYREDNALAEDYELWLSAAIKNDLKYNVLQEPLYYYREVENVKKEKMIKGYNTQIEVINRYYAGVISNNLKNKIVFKFELKKIIVKIFNFFNLMFILQMRRVNNITVSDQARYKANLDKILSV
ncbi:glycosyltransferase [Acinetobacter sp. C32I]|uniref:glycosyltransferase family 2 protein n=1 Tax=Acinetobacter sp. C32I TaxID=2950074 RepID=UPI002036CCCC|nr:glycosyltransferase family 2 protein [Acinetobacter sp. C32I]USA52724.1 glycosyltransferase [Acinetobacter sp. C32I]